MKAKANEAVREAAKKNGVRLWEVAEVLGVADSNFSKILRHELDATGQAKIIAIIEELSAKGAACNDGKAGA